MTNHRIALIRALSLAVSTGAIALALPAQAAITIEAVIEQSPGVSYLTRTINTSGIITPIVFQMEQREDSDLDNVGALPAANSDEENTEEENTSPAEEAAVLIVQSNLAPASGSNLTAQTLPGEPIDGAQGAGAGCVNSASGTTTLECGTNSSAPPVFATAIGASAVASGLNGATAVGFSADATGGWSTAIVRNAQATANDTTALGNNARALAIEATAIGTDASAFAARNTVVGSSANANSGTDATAVGYQARADGQFSVALGAQSDATARGAIAIGGDGDDLDALGAQATGSQSIAIGADSTASGIYSTASGNNSTAAGNGAIAIAIATSRFCRLHRCCCQIAHFIFSTLLPTSQTG
jgi:hypothetical protein